MTERIRRRRYEVRHFKVPDGGYHECFGDVVAVLGATRSEAAWYITVLIRTDRATSDEETPDEGRDNGSEEDSV